MPSLAFMLMMQFLVSTKAGLVNYVQGPANVKAARSVPVGTPIETGPGGAVEILLNPGSYLRLGEKSGAIIEQAELANIAVRITHGSAVIEATGLNKKAPIKVTTGNLRMEIISDGAYSFSDGTVTVIDGKIRDADTHAVYKKGYQISDNGELDAAKIKVVPTALETWSRQRSELIAAANTNITKSLVQNSNIPLDPFLNVWLWAPGIGAFVYMPAYGYRSPYGYRYLGLADYYYYYGGFASPAYGGFGGGSVAGGPRIGAAGSGVDGRLAARDGRFGARDGGRSSAFAGVSAAPRPSLSSGHAAPSHR